MKAQTPRSVTRTLAPTPFHDRLAELNFLNSWRGWNGFLSAEVFECSEKEYFAIRNQATLMDISPMCKYRICGPDATRIVNRLIVRDIRKVKVGRVAYAMWCDEEGMTIDDGTIFRLGEDEYLLLCAKHMYLWLHECAWGFDAAITDETEALCALSLQGPTAFSVLKAAGLEGAASMKPFDTREIEPGLRISRTGYTGDLGYELFTAPENAHSLWDRLWSAGRQWGICPTGMEALNLARLETGFLAPGVDFQPVHLALRRGRGRTPFELGFGRLVDFDKGHFNGRRALLEHKARGPRYHLVRLDIEGKEPAANAYVYHNGSKVVGHVTSAAWSPTAKRNIAFAELEAPYGGAVRDGLFAEIFIYKEGAWLKRNKKAKVVDEPFYRNARARQTPPNAF